MPGKVAHEKLVRDVVCALAEDIGSGDLTASLVADDAQLETLVVCREHAVLAGRDWFDQTFAQLGGKVEIHWHASDGERVSPDQKVCSLRGNARTILSGERTALNFLQTLSATATATRAYVDAVATTGVRILDTRKTLPGMRIAQKYAVRCGGGSNHRIGLFDAVLIKENHIDALGSITNAVRAARDIQDDVLLEVEVENLAELAEAVNAGAQRALLDNFPVKLLEQAVADFGGSIELEASGGIELASIRAIAETGVDFISIGAITKHIKAVDFSMRFV